MLTLTNKIIIFFKYNLDKMSDIIIHLFEAPQDIFEKIFSKKGKIIEKNYGKIETKSFEKKRGFLKRKEDFN